VAASSGKTELMNAHVPVYRGGGMVLAVTDSDASWLESPELWEAGSPNYFGTITLAKACEALKTVGFDAIAAHEQKLLRRALDGLKKIDGVKLYADSDKIDDRVGVLTFNVKDVKAEDVAEKLAGNWGIAVRQGEFCAHPLCHRLLGIPDEEIVAHMHDPNYAFPAMVRVSMGMYNTEEDVDTLIEAVTKIATDKTS
jgi:selenocysteine lyase/cysteine desulfurase